MKNYSFTYGTLMKGQRAHNYFKDMNYIGDGILKDYGLYEVGSFPAALPVEGFTIYGEIYEIDDKTLEFLDNYESEGRLYIRKLIEVESNNKKLDCWFYEYNHDASNLELRAPIDKWNSKRNPISNYAWYVCYGSNLLRKRFDIYLELTDSIVYAEKPYMLEGEIYFAKRSGKWEDKGICFLDLNKKDKRSYGWAYLVDASKIDKISEKEGPIWYPKQELGNDEYGIKVYTVTNNERFEYNQAGEKYLTIIAAGLIERFGLTTEQISNYLNYNGMLDVDEKRINDILEDAKRPIK